MANFLDLIYALALLGATPYLAWQRFRSGKYRRGWWPKLTGWIPPRSSRLPCAWLHAVSVGEVLLLRPLLAQLRQHYPHWELVLTVGTETGYDLARRTFPDLTVCFAPFDFSWAIRNVFERLRPNLVILVELELWPNWLREAQRRQVPVAVINGRLSQHSYHGYRRLGRWFTDHLRCVQLWAVQNATYADRLRRLGVSPARIVVTGSLKFDGVATQRHQLRTVELAHLFGLTPPDSADKTELVWVAGSTQEPEETLVLQIYARLHARWPQLRLILVPRHQERFEHVARLIQQHGWPLLRRSSLSLPQPGSSQVPPRPDAIAAAPPPPGEKLHARKPPVILVDTLGELAAVWGLADVAFVGGSFGNRGGQNMLEPAALGVPVIFGPHVWNFQEIADELCRADAAIQVHSPHELEAVLVALLADAPRRQLLGQRARSFVVAHQGAVHRTVQALHPFFTKAALTDAA